MLERPALPDDQLIACLRAHYGVQADDLEFLPLGADPDTAVFRLRAADGRNYFVKLRSGAFDEVTVAVPHLLAHVGNEHVIAPIATPDGRLHVPCGAFAVVLYPFVAGRDGFDVALTPPQWVTLGRALRDLHGTSVPAPLAQQIPRETFTAVWRDGVRGVLADLDAARAGIPRQSHDREGVVESLTLPARLNWPWPAADDVAHAVAALLQSERAKVQTLVETAERLAASLAAKNCPYVLCHADIHVWNLLITAEGVLYIVDWDTVLFAPKERDLMFFGSGLGGWQRPEQAAAFYGGYGPCAVDPDALAYYRCERIVEDIAVYCRELLQSDTGGADRAEQLHQLAGQFEPGGVVDIALASAQSVL
jgi:spectinomycin phosphotransferase